MITEVDKLFMALEGWDFKLMNISFGTNPSTPEETARAIRKSMIAIRRGKGRDIDLSF